MVKKLKSTAGFTLVEMLIVVVILSVLAGIILPRFTGRTKQTKIAAAKIDISEGIVKALDLFEIDNGFFPATDLGLDVLLTNKANSSLWKGPYVTNNALTDPWGNNYLYLNPGINNKDSYDLWSVGQDGVSGSEDDIRNW